MRSNNPVVKHAYNSCVTRHAPAEETGPATAAQPALADDERLTAVGLFMEAASGMKARFSGQLIEHGLSDAEFEVLIRLVRTPGGALRMSDLAAQTQLTTSGITRVVDRLERHSLVERRACPTDRRGLLTFITAAGRARLDKVLPGHLELIELWLTGLFSAADLEDFLRHLRVVRDAVRPDATAGAGS